MTDVTQGNGIERTTTGEIAEPGSQSQQQPTEQTTTSTTETKPEAAVEAKPEGEKDKSLLTKSTEAKPGEKAAPEGAPEKYEPFTLPEGLELDEKVAGEFTTLAKTLNLSQANAQQLIDFHIKTITAAQDAPMQLWKETQNKWTKDAVSDPILGDGKDLKPEVKARAAKLIDSLGPLAEPFRKAMDFTGTGNHPDFIRAFDALAQRMTEGTYVRGNGASAAGQRAPGAKPQSAAAAMYPNLPNAG